MYQDQSLDRLVGIIKIISYFFSILFTDIHFKLVKKGILFQF